MKKKILLIVLLAVLVGVYALINMRVNYANPIAHGESGGHSHGGDGHSEDIPEATYEPGNTVVITTNKGVIKLILFEKDTPITCKNFIELTNKGFYNGLKFFNVDRMAISAGSPNNTSTGGSKNKIKLEVVEGLEFEAPYMVGMVREALPDSATSKFFITKRPARDELAGNYACFGRVYEGDDIVDKIEMGDVMESVKIIPTPKETADMLKKAAGAE